MAAGRADPRVTLVRTPTPFSRGSFRAPSRPPDRARPARHPAQPPAARGSRSDGSGCPRSPATTATSRRSRSPRAASPARSCSPRCSRRATARRSPRATCSSPTTSARPIGAPRRSTTPTTAAPRRRSPSPVPDGVISGWVKALSGTKAGSRVLMVVPPEGRLRQGRQPAGRHQGHRLPRLRRRRDRRYDKKAPLPERHRPPTWPTASRRSTARPTRRSPCPRASTRRRSPSPRSSPRAPATGGRQGQARRRAVHRRRLDRQAAVEHLEGRPAGRPGRRRGPAEPVRPARRRARRQPGAAAAARTSRERRQRRRASPSSSTCWASTARPRRRR